MAILARVLESAGFRVGMISQPDWHSCEPWRTFGRPRLFFAISRITGWARRRQGLPVESRLEW